MEPKRALLPALVLVAAAATSSAQVDYRLSFEPGGKAWSVEARFPARPGSALEFWLPRWTPGDDTGKPPRRDD